MTGPQAAQVYYAPAIRNPIKLASQQAVVQRVAPKHADKLSSEKFVFQKATKMDSPQRREFQSKMSIKSSPFDEVPGMGKESSNMPYNMPAINKQAH